MQVYMRACKAVPAHYFGHRSLPACRYLRRYPVAGSRMKMRSLYKALLSLFVLTAVTDCAPTVEKKLSVEPKETPLRGPPSDCADLYGAGQNHSGVYNIFPTGDSEQGLPVYCDMESDGGGWTVIQKRGQYGNPALYFKRDWKDYANGFGDPAKEYWLGNRAIHNLTSSKQVALRIQLKNHTGETLIADYKLFSVASEEDLFRIKVGNYTGEKGADSLSYSNGMAFSTFDRDNDAYNGSCAEAYKGGWWYKSCYRGILNGLNLNGEKDNSMSGVEWSRRHGFVGLFNYSYPEAEMKIRALS